MSDEFVFPQDHFNTDEKGNAYSQSRKGGLTKRELFAAMIFAADTKNTLSFGQAVAAADGLLEALEKPRA